MTKQSLAVRRSFASPLAMLAAVLLSPAAGAAPTPVVNPARPLDTAAAVAEALAAKPAAQRSPAERAAASGFEALLAGDVPRAESAFDQALKSDPKLSFALLGLADVRIRQQRPAEAQTLLKRALANEPRNATLHAALGRYYRVQGDLARAKASYGEAIRLDPGALLPHLGLADLYATGERDPRAAAEEYRKALAIQPDYHPARLGLGLALLAGGDRAGALVELQRLAKDTPTDPTAWHLIGRIHASEKRYGEAVKALTEALRIQPDFLPALLDRADVHAAAGEDRKAAADYEQALKRQPGDAVSRVKLGMIYQRMGDTDKAEASYRAALKANPDLPPARPQRRDRRHGESHDAQAAAGRDLVPPRSSLRGSGAQGPGGQGLPARPGDRSEVPGRRRRSVAGAGARRPVAAGAAAAARRGQPDDAGRVRAARPRRSHCHSQLAGGYRPLST